jgi:hypothetical protein
MTKLDTSVVKRLLKERPKDLLDLMEGDSKYCTRAPRNIPQTKDEVYVRRMALEHVWFVSQFGSDVLEAERDGHFYSAYPEYFERWLSMGCLTLDEVALEGYLRDNEMID